MYKIVTKRKLNDSVVLVEVEAPFIAKKVLPGQFVIFRIDELGERVPVTVADYDREKGTITMIVQTVGRSTIMLGNMEEGEYLQDVVGPLGLPTELENVKKVCVIGGGVGCAIAYPQAKALHNDGVQVDVIAGFRSKDIVIIEEEMRAVADRYFVMTDDGSYGEKGFVSNVLERLIQEGNQYDAVIVIGPLMMMKAVSELTRPYGIKTIVSMNPIMIDGTGMCGGCRLTVGGETKFACVDGPDFDGHQVDFDEAIKRSRFFREEEMRSRDEHCRLMQKGEKADEQ